MVLVQYSPKGNTGKRDPRKVLYSGNGIVVQNVTDRTLHELFFFHNVIQQNPENNSQSAQSLTVKIFSLNKFSVISMICQL